MSFVTTALAPSPDLFAEGAILVNKHGERFTDEVDKPAFALTRPARQSRLHPARQAHGGAVFRPGRISSRPRPALPMPMSTTIGAIAATFSRAAPTLAELAGQSSAMPADALGRTVHAHNANAGNRPTFGEGPVSWRSGRCAPCSCTPKAGSRSIMTIACWARATSPSPGSTPRVHPARAGFLLKGHGHHLGWAFASGRRAGRNAANANA